MIFSPKGFVGIWTLPNQPKDEFYRATSGKQKTARGLATHGRWDFWETLLGFFERGLGGGEAGYWHAER